MPVPESDPFVTTYAPYTGGRLPETWEFAWVGEDPTERIVGYAVPGHPLPVDAPGLPAAGPRVFDDTPLRLAPGTEVRYTGTSLLRRRTGHRVTALYARRGAALFELPVPVAELLTDGCSFKEFARAWERAEAVTCEHARRVVAAMARYRVLDAPAAPPPAAGRRVRHEVLVEYLPRPTGEAVLNSLVTGRRVRLTPEAVEVWRSCAVGRPRPGAGDPAAEVVVGLLAAGLLVEEAGEAVGARAGAIKGGEDR